VLWVTDTSVLCSGLLIRVRCVVGYLYECFVFWVTDRSVLCSGLLIRVFCVLGY
jgi:hypothetical protein